MLCKYSYLNLWLSGLKRVSWDWLEWHNTIEITLFVLWLSYVTFFLYYSSDPCKPGQPKPALPADSEVYKMLQENQESNEPPRQSASFKVLQEILETGIISKHTVYTLLHCVWITWRWPSLSFCWQNGYLQFWSFIIISCETRFVNGIRWSGL